MLSGNKLEVHGMDDRPDLPGSLAGTEKVRLDLVSNGGKGVSVDQSEVSKENTHEDGAPHNLVNSNLQGNIFGFGSWDLLVEPVVEVMARGSVVNETEEGESQETLHIKWSSADKDLINYCLFPVAIFIEER